MGFPSLPLMYECYKFQIYLWSVQTTFFLTVWTLGSELVQGTESFTEFT